MSPLADHGIVDYKAKVDLVEIVGRHVKLTKKGSANPEHWGCCPFHVDGTPSFKVSPKRQEFHCFGCGAHGDVLDFLKAHEGLDTASAIKRLRELGNGERPQRPWSPTNSAPQPDRNGELAREIWRQTETIADGLPFDYLCKRRGLIHWDCDRVRWHPACPWGEARVSCIVAPVISHLTGLTVGIWRIWPSMTEPMKDRRKGLGPAKGNFSPTWWPDGDELAIAEGVEDALAVRALTGLPCWAALSAGNMGELHGIPRWIKQVTVFADGDDVGRRGAHQLAHRLREEGRHVRVLRSLSGKDPNDVLIQRAG